MGIGMIVGLRDSRLQQVIDLMDGGLDTVTTTAMMHFYDGVRPATGGAVTGLVASCALSQPSGTITAGVLTFATVSDDVSADADADITWCRIVDSDGAFVMDLGCGIAASGEEIIFNTVTARIGGVVQILSGSFNEGNA